MVGLCGAVAVLAAGTLALSTRGGDRVGSVELGASPAASAAVTTTTATPAAAPASADITGNGTPTDAMATPAHDGGAVVGAAPVTMTLPGVAHPADVVPEGVQPDGQMDLPADPQTVGWWSGGAAPGDAGGSILLVGHIDSATEGLGVFARLPSLGTGQHVTVTDADGHPFVYVVSSRRQVAKAELRPEELTSPRPGGLVLVTCGGRFDPRTHYSDNIIVYADPLV